MAKKDKSVLTKGAEAFLRSPVYGLATVCDRHSRLERIIAVAGGGALKTGLRNRLVLFNVTRQHPDAAPELQLLVDFDLGDLFLESVAVWTSRSVVVGIVDKYVVGFAWDVLAHEVAAPRLAFAAQACAESPDEHEDWVCTAAVGSPDGKQLATSADDGSVRLWRVASEAAAPPRLGFGPVDALGPTRRLTLVAELRGHTSSVADVTWGPHGRVLVSSGDDGCTRLWEVAAGQVQVLPTAHPGRLVKNKLPSGKAASRHGLQWRRARACFSSSGGHLFLLDTTSQGWAVVSRWAPTPPAAARRTPEDEPESDNEHPQLASAAAPAVQGAVVTARDEALGDRLAVCFLATSTDTPQIAKGGLQPMSLTAAAAGAGNPVCCASAGPSMPVWQLCEQGLVKCNGSQALAVEPGLLQGARVAVGDITGNVHILTAMGLRPLQTLARHADQINGVEWSARQPASLVTVSTDTSVVCRVETPPPPSSCWCCSSTALLLWLAVLVMLLALALGMWRRDPELVAALWERAAGALPAAVCSVRQC